MSLIPIGTRIKFRGDIYIKFRGDIYEDATGDHPEFILARKGELGTITEHVFSDKRYPYRVTWDEWEHPFSACEDDLEIVE